MTEGPAETPSLEGIDDLEYGVWKATLLKVALELDLFTAVAAGHRLLEEIVSVTQTSERGMRILLDALCPLGLLSKFGREYLLTPTSDAYLVRGRPTFYGDWCLETQLAWDVRSRAAGAVRTGEAVGGDYPKPDTNDLWAADLRPAILDWPRRAERARRAWETLGVPPGTRPGLHILDVACGPGVKSFVPAQADPRARVTALDFPRVLQVTSQIAEAMGVSGQVTLRPGDLMTADLGAEDFDIVLFGAILYYFTPEQLHGIFQRTYRALRPGGLVVINEMIADEGRCRLNWL